MKQPKALTRNQKEAVSAYNLNPKDWAYVEDISEMYIKIINKDTGKVKLIDKYAKPPKTRRY